MTGQDEVEVFLQRRRTNEALQGGARRVEELKRDLPSCGAR